MNKPASGSFLPGGDKAGEGSARIFAVGGGLTGAGRCCLDFVVDSVRVTGGWRDGGGLRTRTVLTVIRVPGGEPKAGGEGDSEDDEVAVDEPDHTGRGAFVIGGLAETVA